MHINLTPELENFIRAKVRSGYYTDASDVVRDALRRLQAADAGGAAGGGEPPGGAARRRLGRLAPAGAGGGAGGGAGAGGRAGAGPGAAAAAGAGVAAAPALESLPPLLAMPVVAELPPLLPALEVVRIEGAEVMPEVNQSLAQIDASIGKVGGLSASLAPAPDKVPQVKAAMDEADAELRRQLDEF
jgi:hypothetical protein